MYIVLILFFCYRNLTPVALLTAIRTYRTWMNIARGDPVLRRTVRQQLLTERRQREELLRNPDLHFSIQREGAGEQPKVFGRNVIKTVTRTNTDDFRAALIDSRREQMSFGKQYREGNAGGKARTRKTNKAAPYKSLRC